MRYQDFMNKVRHWDNKSSQWFFRHFYLMFFQVILVVVFVIFFFVTINVINQTPDRASTDLERMLVSQNTIGLMITFLMLLNSFWMLFMLASIFKVRSILKNIDFNLSRRQTDHRYDETL